MLYNNLSVCSEELQNFDQEIGLGRTVIAGQACVRVGRRSGSLQVLEQSRIGDTAALGFLPNCGGGGGGEALNHKQDEASVNLWAVLGRVVLRAEA